MENTLREICTAIGVSRRAVQGYEKLNLVTPTCAKRCIKVGLRGAKNAYAIRQRKDGSTVKTDRGLDTYVGITINKH